MADGLTPARARAFQYAAELVAAFRGERALRVRLPRPSVLGDRVAEKIDFHQPA